MILKIIFIIIALACLPVALFLLKWMFFCAYVLPIFALKGLAPILFILLFIFGSLFFGWLGFIAVSFYMVIGNYCYESVIKERIHA